MRYSSSLLLAIACVAWSASSCGASTDDSKRPQVEPDGTVRIPGFSVPLSRYMSEEAKRQFIEQARNGRAEHPEKDPPVSKMRSDIDEYYRPLVDRARLRYPVNVEDRRIGGVPTQVVTPKDGVSVSNETRVLINLHGGGFIAGAGLGGLAEAIPIAGRGRIKVVSVDYRMAPEHHFPAASQDVAAVYSDLLRQYQAENIGIYGCSAGGILSAMAVAWLQTQKLPTPGAIGIFGAGAYSSSSGSPAEVNTWGGDSSFVAPPLVGQPPLPVDGKWLGTLAGAMDYAGNVDKQDPLASPALSSDILAKFPPTLLITGTRAWDMSAAVQTHRLLTKAGTRANLHVWDGMGHCFLHDVDLPESQEAYAVISHFFGESLGRRDR